MSAGDGNLWWVGVIMSLLASVGSVVGMALQKIGHQRNQLLPENERKGFLQMPCTWIGVAVMVLIPAPLDIGALLFARYSVLAPFSGFTLVLNALSAPFLLGEHVEYVDYISSAMICFGTGITTVYGSHTDRAYDVPRLYHIYFSTKCLIYTIVGGGLTFVIACICWYRFPDARQDTNDRRASADFDESLSLETEGLTAGRRNSSGEYATTLKADAHLAGDGSQCDSSSARKAKHIDDDWTPLLLAYLNGVAGSTQQICVKTLIELAKTTYADDKEEEEYEDLNSNNAEGEREYDDDDGASRHADPVRPSNNQFRFGLTYFLVFVAVLSVLLQFRLLNYGLEHYNSITYVPRYSAMFILTGILGGWFYLGDADELPATSILMFLCGGGVTVMGVLLLQIRPVRNTKSSAVSSVAPVKSNADLHVHHDCYRNHHTRKRVHVAAGTSVGLSTLSAAATEPAPQSVPGQSSQDTLHARKRSVDDASDCASI